MELQERIVYFELKVQIPYLSYIQYTKILVHKSSRDI